MNNTDDDAAAASETIKKDMRLVFPRIAWKCFIFELFKTKLNTLDLCIGAYCVCCQLCLLVRCSVPRNTPLTLLNALLRTHKKIKIYKCI